MSINRNNGSPPRAVEEKKGRFGAGAAEPVERDELSKDDSTASANRIRQGVTGHNVRYVLLLSTAGVVLAFIFVYVAFFG